MLVSKSKLGVGVASAAVAIGLASPSQAACVVDGSTVVCEDDNTVSADVNAAVASVVGDDVTLQVSETATVQQPGATVTSPQQGEVAIENAGVFGDDVAPVNVYYSGSQGSDANSFSLTNGGTITGGIDIESVGTTISIVNSGAIATQAGDVSATADGDISVINSGVIGAEDDGTGSSDLASVSIETLRIEDAATGVPVVETDGDLQTTTTVLTDLQAIGGLATVEQQQGGVSGAINARGLGGTDVNVDGTVGASDASASISASSFDAVAAQTSVSELNTVTGDASSTTTTIATSVGGSSSVEIGATGTVFGSVDAIGNSGAAIANDGDVTGNLLAQAGGGQITQEAVSTTTSTGTTSSQADTLILTAADAVVTNGADALIGTNPNSPVSVIAQATGTASVDNAGRINGNIAVDAERFDELENSDFSSSTVTDGSGATVVTNSSGSSSSTKFTGGDAEFSNAQGGLVSGDLEVNGAGSATVVNQGAVIGRTDVASEAQDVSQASANAVVVTTAADSSGTIVTTTTSNGVTAESGGDVTGTYAGTNGAVQFAPFGGASDGSVRQVANGDSSATVTGTIFGDFSGEAVAQTNSSDSVNERTESYAAGGVIQSNVFTSTITNETSYGDSASSLAVDGGTIAGNVDLFADGDVNAAFGNGASVEGELYLGTRYQANQSDTAQYDDVISYDDTGAFEGRTITDERTANSVAGAGNISTTIGDATIGGSVFQYGAAGENSFALGEDGEVLGSVEMANFGYSNATNQLTETQIDAVGNTANTNSYVFSETAEGGDVSAVVAGTIASDLEVVTNGGSASVELTGQIADDIYVSANGTDYAYSSAGSDENGVTTNYVETGSSTNVGGTASLNVDAPSLSAPANFGSIEVQGVGGSSVSIGENSNVLASASSDDLEVGGIFTDSTFAREDVYENGVVVSRTRSSTATSVGGDASLVNDGQIGIEGSNADYVEVTSISNAQVENSGTIFGNVAINSLSEDVQSTTQSINIGDVTQTDTTETVYTAVGGNAALTNDGLITNGVSVAAATGAITNDGELLGGLALGGSVDNYTTQQVDTFSQAGSETVVVTPDAFVQDYSVEQNGILTDGIVVAGAFGNEVDADGAPVMTSDINAVINLNEGSTTTGTIYAEYDAATGQRFTNTTVNLNGSGSVGDLASRILGVETLAKTGDGSFLLTGDAYVASTTSMPQPSYTLDVGQLAVSGGELQLDTVDGEVFGIRGDILNEATLVLGKRETIAAPLFGIEGDLEIIDGADVYQLGNFTQTDEGALALGITPTLVRTFQPSVGSGSVSTNPLGNQQILISSGLFTTAEAAGIDAENGSLTIDGNLDLSGQVQLVSPVSGLFLGGETLDVASVSGTVTENADVVAGSPSNFVTFDLATRQEAGRTVVFVQADRQGYDTVALNNNAEAAGQALTDAMPNVIANIQAGTAGGIGIGSEEFMFSQDLANVMVAFDTLLTANQASAALNDLASGDIYGSFAAVRTTSPFVDAVSNRRIPAGARGFNVWIQPAAEFASFDGDSDVGSNGFDANSYGGAAGFGYANGRGEFGIGFGYGEIDADADDRPIEASASTWMLGAYAHQAFDEITIAGDMVYGWSQWDVTREMPTLGRTANADFDSTEFRASLRAEYRYDLGSAYLAPFAKIELRSFDFDGFEEAGAGAVGLAVKGSSESVFTPSLGLKVGSSFNAGQTTIRPEASVAYNFAGDAKTDREVAYLGARNVPFTLQGVDPEGYVSLTAGLYGDIGLNSSAYISGGYATGGDADAAQIRGGVVFGF